jgi:membrane dipeptidase
VISRRTFLAASLAGPSILNRGADRLFGAAVSPLDRYSSATLELLSESTVIDMLGLLSLDYRKLWEWHTDPQRLRAADIERLRASGITVFHPAVGYTEGDVYTSSLRDIQGWAAFLDVHSDTFLRIDCAADLQRAKASGKIGIIVGQQNSAHFRSVEDVDRFYELGQRVSQLTYAPNRIGGGSSDPRDPGLTAYGLEIVTRMNQLGMAIDVSHCADRTTLAAIEASSKPVLITHSNCRALVANSARCKTDDSIRQMARRGGVMGVTMVRSFVRASGPATIEDVLDHIDHIVQIAGIEHAGVGSDVDLDGRDRNTPAKRYDLDRLVYQQKMFDLTEGLVRRRYSKENIRLILGGNFQRALREIWREPEAPSAR